MSNRLYSKNSFVKSGLITGTQWDMIMKFLSSESNYSDIKSTNWGNYKNTSLTDLRGYYTNVTSAGATDGFKSVIDSSAPLENSGTRKSGYAYVLLTTGSTEKVLKKGLYEISGNLWEWTQEASYKANLSYNTTYNSYILRGRCFQHCVRR